MSDPTGNVFLAVTTSSGTVHTTVRDASSGNWSTFETISALSGRKYIDVTGSSGALFAMDSSRLPQMWLTHRFVTWQPAVRRLIGIAPAVANNSHYIAVLGVGTTGVGFSLPLYVMEHVGAPPTLRGDQLGVVDKGPLDLTDFPLELDVEGVFERDSSIYQLCLCTESGGLYYTRVPDPAGTRPVFIDLKTASSDPGAVKSVSCSTAGEGLQVCIVDGTGAIKHANRNDFSGAWTSFGTVSAPAGTRFLVVAARGFNGINFKNPLLHMVGITDSGGILHTIRPSSGSWSPFFDIKSQAGDPGVVTSLCLYVHQYSIG